MNEEDKEDLKLAEQWLADIEARKIARWEGPLPADLQFTGHFNNGSPEDIWPDLMGNAIIVRGGVLPVVIPNHYQSVREKEESD